MYIIVYVYYYIMYLLYIYTICIAYLHWRYTIFSQLLDHKSHTPLLFSLYNGHLRTGPTKVVRCNVIAAAFYPLVVYKCNRVYSVCDETTTALRPISVSRVRPRKSNIDGNTRYIIIIIIVYNTIATTFRVIQSVSLTKYIMFGKRYSPCPVANVSDESDVVFMRMLTHYDLTQLITILLSRNKFMV